MFVITLGVPGILPSFLKTYSNLLFNALTTLSLAYIGMLPCLK